MIRGIERNEIGISRLYVINKTGSPITAGKLVYINGYDKTSEKPTIALADADAGLSASFIALKAIANDAVGEVLDCAEVGSLNTSGASAVGSPIYLSATDGGWTVTAPTGINQLVQKVGFVTVKHASTGKIVFLLNIVKDINGKVLGTFSLQDGSVANAKLATDAKVGSLATLTTTEKASVVGAINEVDSNADAKYTKPGTGIPSTDLASAVQTSLGKADTALQSIADDSVTNAKLGTDVKVGSLAALNTSEKGSVVGAINEVRGTAITASQSKGVKTVVVAGGSIGDINVTGIAVGDTLIGVIRFDVEVDTGTSASGNKVQNVADIKAECTVGAGKITTASTDTTGDVLMVIYDDLT
jgi:hypothetical protein